MAKSNIFDDIKADVKQYAMNISKYSAIEVREQLYQATKSAIDKFYADYTPGDYHQRKNDFMAEMIENGEDDGYVFTEAHCVYQRTYNLYNSYKKYYKNNHDRTFSGGVILSPDFMKDTYRGGRELVFDLAYAGYHGLNSWDFGSPRPASPYAVTSPSPMDMIEKKQNGIANHPEPIIHKAIMRANGDAYSYFKRGVGRPRTKW